MHVQLSLRVQAAQQNRTTTAVGKQALRILQ
jgi:hypothetical protein